MSKMKKVVKVEGKVEDVVKSCIKLFGSARTRDEILAKIYSRDELKKALEIIDKLDLMQDVNEDVLDVNEVSEMSEIEVNEKGEEIMKKAKVVKVQDVNEVLDMHIDNDGIDALKDTRVVNSDHGVDNKEDNLEWWLMHAKNSEMKPVPFRDVLNHFDKGVYKGTIRNVYAYFKFGQRRFVVNVNLEPIYSKAEHRGYVFESCPVFMSFSQYENICNELGWDFDNMESVKGEPVNIVIDYNEETKANTYFIQGKAK